MKLTIIIGILIGLLTYASLQALSKIINTCVFKRSENAAFEALIICITISLIYILSNL